MAKIFYSYDPSTSQYTRIEFSIWYKLWKGFKLSLLVIAAAFGLFYCYISLFELPGEIKLKNDIKDLEISFAQLDQKLTGLNKLMSSIETRDDQVYRAVLGA